MIFSLKKGLLLISVLMSQLFANSIVTDFLLLNDTKFAHEGTTIETIYENNPFSKNYLEKARVSIEHSHFSDVEREYSVRLYTKSPAEVQDEEETFLLEKRINEHESSIDLLNTQKQRYQILTELIYKFAMRDILDDEISFQNTALQKSKYFIDKQADIVNLYKKKQALNDLSLQRSKLQMEIDNLLAQIEEMIEHREKSTLTNEINLHTLLFPYELIKLIKEELDNNSSINIDTNPLLRKESDRISLAEHKVETIRHQNQIKLDYIGIKYDDSKKSKNALSVNVAVEIPISKDTNRIVKEKISVLKSKQKAARSRQKIEYKISRLKNEIKNLLGYFTEVDAQITTTMPKKNNFYTYKLYESMKKRNLKLKKQRTKVAYQITQKYINLLYLSNMLDKTQLYTLYQRTQ